MGWCPIALLADVAADAAAGEYMAVMTRQPIPAAVGGGAGVTKLQSPQRRV